ncbi:hypothetical protein AUEXF2481DRAFT_642171 [Aureobasidium subglaciale EXF-2481]|uniref:Zn(2)-C6 fungal-type domain-containing protein n=1 Tax=Aureobasidium subglaciale (strain EXF-2481) TaxID=1043005 RepID=A0A074YKC0_AURSE|nr:uncharacterized protein AUEXF2481DRAFT_642171 [Aureobasidium subglaciale EXF-2481]KEQ96519.1 hypothetical protein AUEXF2481DRAFT_642171 [Aureobasidium subglaciale EXF-2481]
MELKAKRQRAVGIKYSKNGCRTCRIRRVKCDETRPDCNSCTSTGRTCDGYKDDPSRKRGSALQRPLLPAPTSPFALTAVSRQPSTIIFRRTQEDHFSFRFFTEHVVPGWKLLSPNHEWIDLSLQLAAIEPCIYFAIAACGSVVCARLEKPYHCYFTPPSPVKMKRNLSQYCQATSALQKYIDRAVRGKEAIEVVLIACLMFVAYETCQDENALAIQHLKMGKRAIEDCRGAKLRFSTKKVESDIVDAFDWMGAQSVEHGIQRLSCKGNSGMGSDLSVYDSLERAKRALEDLAAITSSWRTDLLASAAEYLMTTVGCSDQRSAITECIKHCVCRSMPLSTSHPLLLQQTRLLEAHEAWLQGLTEFEQTTPDRRPLIHMQIQHFYSFFILCTARYTQSSQYNHFNDQASAVLDLVEEFITTTSAYTAKAGPTLPALSKDALYPYTPLPQEPEQCFALEYAILPTLLAICFKIQHSAMRHRALQLLRVANRREAGQWSGELYHYADAIIALEQSKAGADVFQDAGLLEVVIEDAGFLQVSLVCGRFSHETDGSLEVLEYMGAGLPPLRLQLAGRSVFFF